MDLITNIVAATAVCCLFGMLGLYRLIHKIEQKVDSALAELKSKDESFSDFRKKAMNQIEKNEKEVKKIDSWLTDTNKRINDLDEYNLT